MFHSVSNNMSSSAGILRRRNNTKKVIMFYQSKNKRIKLLNFFRPTVNKSIATFARKIMVKRQNKCFVHATTKFEEKVS